MAVKYYKILDEMIEEMGRAPYVFQTPLLSRDRESITNLDLDTFKSTSILRDFAVKSSPQIRALQHQLPKTFQIKNRVKAFFSQKFSALSKRKSVNYTYLTLLLWDYLACTLPKKLVELEEPALGNPLFVKWQNRFVTRDLANSLLEFHSITGDVEQPKIRSVLELGGGYGRLGFVFLKLWPTIKYIVVDNPQALFISQNYLTTIFEHRKIFKFRPFTDYAKIKGEFEDSDICFLLPHQIELLPDYSIDLGINISTFHEMRREQIKYYFEQFFRLVSGYFYFKQPKESRSGNTILREADYPVPPDWEEVFWRTNPTNTHSFEALFKR